MRAAKWGWVPDAFAAIAEDLPSARCGVTVAQQWRQRLAFMRGNVRVLTVTGALTVFALNLMFPYVSLYVLSLGGGPAQIGWANALVPLAGLIALPLGGYLADHGRRVPVLVFTGLYGAVIYLALGRPHGRIPKPAAHIEGPYIPPPPKPFP